jgi:hypothetical protein
MNESHDDAKIKYLVKKDFEVYIDNPRNPDNDECDLSTALIGKGSEIIVSLSEEFDVYDVQVLKYKKGNLFAGTYEAKKGKFYYANREDITEGADLKVIR